MLNRAARFFPILRKLQSKLPPGGAVLEVGSGPTGLGEFWTGKFVGCDIGFPSRPITNMLAVRCSGHQLPFADGSFDAVVVSDVMEHVPPVQRDQVLHEVLRVARKVIIFGYPCGKAAFELDQKLYHLYRSLNVSPPVWLEEHMLFPFPDSNLFIDLPRGWTKEAFPNESLRFHYWMMRAEMSWMWDYSFRALLRILPAFVEFWLRYADAEPSYRMIFVLSRDSEEAHA